MKRKSQYIFILISNLIVWTLMTLNDCLSSRMVTVLYFLALFMPFIVLTIYITVDYELNEEFDGKQHIFFMIRYLIVTLLIGGPVTLLANENMWVVRRIVEEWDHDMTGFYYIVLGALMLIGCESGFVLYGVIRSVKKKYKERKHDRLK